MHRRTVLLAVGTLGLNAWPKNLENVIGNSCASYLWDIQIRDLADVNKSNCATEYDSNLGYKVFIEDPQDMDVQ